MAEKTRTSPSRRGGEACGEGEGGGRGGTFARERVIKVWFGLVYGFLFFLESSAASTFVHVFYLILFDMPTPYQ